MPEDLQSFVEYQMAWSSPGPPVRIVPIRLIGLTHHARLGDIPVTYVWGNCPVCGTELRSIFAGRRPADFAVSDSNRPYIDHNDE
jgi:hypothetical protein